MQLGIKEVAGLFGVSEGVILRWIKDRGLPAYRVSDQYRFGRAELLEWAIARRGEALPPMAPTTAEGAARLPRLDQALAAGGVHRLAGGADKAAVLREVVEVLDLPEEGLRPLIHDLLLARESLGSTGVGDGIAIPHVRHPLLLPIPRPLVALCYLARPVDFAALDAQPVGVLFTIVSPTARAHLHLLSRLAFALRRPEFKAAVLAREDAPAILAAAARFEEALPPASPPAGPTLNGAGT